MKTNNFNSFINTKVREYNSRLNLELDVVYIKLNLMQGAININTKDSILIAENDEIKILNTDINLNIIKFIKKENSIKDIKIQFSENSIKKITSLLNTTNFDLSRYVLYSQIKKGLIKFKLEAEFDTISQKLNSYSFSGSIKEAKFNLLGYDNIDRINLNFNTKDKLTKISNLNFRYQNLNLISESIEIKSENSGLYFIKGDIENSEALINPNVLFKFANIKQDFLSNVDIQIKSKNFFSFRFNKFKKLENIKIDSIINFDEIYFDKKYKNIIFLKDGTINSKYENSQFNADLTSNFVFSNNLRSKNNYKSNKLKLFLKSKNDKKFKINGNISNSKTPIDPKILINLLGLDANLISDEIINIETDNQFKFEINKSKIENYLVNSNINLDKLELNKTIQDVLYLKNIKTELMFDEEILKLDLKSNYSFFNQNYNNELDNNILNLKLDKNRSKISDVEIFLKTNNNNINTREFKKYINFPERLVEDQIINLDSNFLINFSIDDKFNIKKLNVNSDLNFDNLDINFKSNIVKKYLEIYENKISLKDPNLSFKYSEDIINFQLDGKYSLNNKEDNFFIKFEGNQNNFELYSLLDLDKNILNLRDIQYYKKNNIPAKLEILLNKSKKGFNLKKISLNENQNYISAHNLNISPDFKMQSIEEIDVNFVNTNKILNNFKVKKNSNNYNFIGYQIDGEQLVESLLKGNKKNKISKLFHNINTSLILNINKIYLEKDIYLEKFIGEFDIKENKLFLAKADAILENNKKFSYSYRTTIKNEKITNIFIDGPKPFINNYKFIKGFDEGELKLNSMKIDNTSRSSLKITNFKVKEVPVLAKILTLASLQGIADLLTGEGIRFDEFEMDFKTKNNLTEIDELYAIGPAISIMMEGYIEKDRVTSLRGTLVPATTINKTISKIPLLGNILVGSKTGEGVFGVSFKIKGPPNDLKSSVNPIKTLTPRFITRTLEIIKGD
ncbi:MAG: AsmA-like C-terminal region-containing protein [Candidatus Pelagibacter sp.]